MCVCSTDWTRFCSTIKVRAKYKIFFVRLFWGPCWEQTAFWCAGQHPTEETTRKTIMANISKIDKNRTEEIFHRGKMANWNERLCVRVYPYWTGSLVLSLYLPLMSTKSLETVVTINHGSFYSLMLGHINIFSQFWIFISTSRCFMHSFVKILSIALFPFFYFCFLYI